MTGASCGCSRSTVRVSPSDLVLVVGVDEERERRAVGAGGRLDHVRDVALARSPGRRTRASRPRARRVLREVEVAAVGDPLELATSRSGTGTRRRSCRTSSATARRRRARAGAGGRGGSRARCTSASRSCEPVLEPLLGASSGGTKNSISICSNSRVRKMKLPGVISLRKDLPICAIPNGGFLRENCRYVLEVDEDPLRGLGAQVDGRALLLDRPDRRLEHQVEVARLGQVAVGRLARVLGGLAPARRAGRGGRRGSAACRCGSRRAGR